MEAKFTEFQAAQEQAQANAQRLAELEASFAEMQEAKEAAEALLAEERRNTRRKELEAKVEHLYAEGKLTDGIYPQEDLYEFAVSVEEGMTLDFSEGKSAADVLLSILSNIPVPVEFSEVAPEEDAPAFTEQPEEEMEFSERVEKYASEHNLSFEAALREMARQG